MKLLKKQPSKAVGIWKTEANFQVVWLDENQQLQSFIIDYPYQAELASKIFNQSPELKSYLLKWVSASPNHLIWQRSFIIPLNTPYYEIKPQCLTILEQDLPLPVDECFYDFTTSKLDEKSLRVDLFAINRKLATNYLNQYLPLELDVLEVVSQVMVQGFKFILPDLEDYNTLFIYQENSQVVGSFNQKARILTLTKDKLSVADFIGFFAKQYELNLTHAKIVLWSDEVISSPSSHWQVVDNNIPLIALGCALWQGELGVCK